MQKQQAAATKAAPAPIEGLPSVPCAIAFFYDLLRDHPAIASKVDRALQERHGLIWKEENDE